MNLSIKLLLLASCFLTACDNEIPNDPAPFSEEVLIFGSFAGECIGNCAEYYKIEDGKLYADEVEIGIPDDIPFQSTPLSEEKYQLAAPLLAGIPNELRKSDQQVYGCPDCYDQGGIYLELRTDNRNQKWQIDPDSTDQSSAILVYKQRVIQILLDLR